MQHKLSAIFLCSTLLLSGSVQAQPQQPVSATAWAQVSSNIKRNYSGEDFYFSPEIYASSILQTQTSCDNGSGTDYACTYVKLESTPFTQQGKAKIQVQDGMCFASIDIPFAVQGESLVTANKSYTAKWTGNGVECSKATVVLNVTAANNGTYQFKLMESN